MLDPLYIDIDRLHNTTRHILEHRISELGPQEGTTTAFMYLMLGEIWMSKPKYNYVYIGNDPQQTSLDFAYLLLTNKVEIDSFYSFPTPIFTLPNKQTFKFITIQQANDDNFWTGTKYKKVFFDGTLCSLDSDVRKRLLHNTHCSGAILI